MGTDDRLHRGTDASVRAWEHVHRAVRVRRGRLLKNKSHAVTAQVVVPDAGAQGVIIAQGGAFGGWSLYLREGRPAYCYNLFGLQQFKVHGQERLTPGDHQVRVEL